MDSNNSVSHGLAVLNYQDAAEMLLRATAELVDASIKEKTAFDEIINDDN